MRYPEMEALPVLVVYVNRPFSVTTIQQAAVSVVAADGVIVSNWLSSTSYDETALWSMAPPKASDTIRWSRSSKPKPNGVAPAEAMRGRAGYPTVTARPHTYR